MTADMKTNQSGYTKAHAKAKPSLPVQTALVFFVHYYSVSRRPQKAKYSASGKYLFAFIFVRITESVMHTPAFEEGSL
jgi:hypothetical protein